MAKWREVTKRNPCPICGKPDWCSTLQAFDSTLVCCRREPGGKEKVDKAGKRYWIHRIKY